MAPKWGIHPKLGPKYFLYTFFSEFTLEDFFWNFVQWQGFINKHKRQYLKYFENTYFGSKMGQFYPKNLSQNLVCLVLGIHSNLFFRNFAQWCITAGVDKSLKTSVRSHTNIYIFTYDWNSWHKYFICKKYI